MSPFEAVFGYKPKVGINANYIPGGVADEVDTEEDLKKIISGKDPSHHLVVVTSVMPDDALEEVINTQSSGSWSEYISFVCSICNMSCDGDQVCSKCGNTVHEGCGFAFGDVCTQMITCLVCTTVATAQKNREVPLKNLEAQAAKMLKRSAAKFPPAAVGDTILFRVDFICNSTRNVVCVGLQPNTASKGDIFIPEWNAEFFINSPNGINLNVTLLHSPKFS
ncbi:hypothetical protein DMENIID0001_062940 [Sergentomyia squamirostris]